MKTRDFHNSHAPVLVDPRSGMHVAPPLTGGAQAVKTSGHSGANPNPAPTTHHERRSLEPLVPMPATPAALPEGASDLVYREQAPTEPPASSSPALAAELEQMFASFLPAMKNVATPSDLERLVGVACAVANSDSLIALLSEDLDEPNDGRTVVPGRVEALAHRVVRFADELVRSATSLVARREAPTEP